MIVVISNKLKSVVETSEIVDGDYKCTVGCYSTSDCIKAIESLDIDYLIIDVTAVRDAYEIGSWKRFKDFFNPDKTIILLEQEKSYSNVGFLSMLITMGFYNFAKTAEDLKRLMECPNTYQDVSKYQKIALSMEEKKENSERELDDYHRKMAETQEMMKDYMEKYQNGEIGNQDDSKAFKYQLKTGLLILPLLTVLGVFLIYSMQVLVSNFVPPVDDYVGEYIYSNLANTGFTPLTIIGIMFVMFIFSIYYSSLNSNIKRFQMSRGKFIIIPFAIYCIIIFGEYYLVGILENFYEVIKIFPIVDKPYLCQDLYDLSRWIATAIIFLFYAEILVANSKVLKFEKDLSQSFTFLEKIWVVDIIFLLAIPLAHQVSGAFGTESSLYEALTYLYDQPFVMIFLVAIEIVLTLLIIGQRRFQKEKQYTILKEEDL